MNALFIFIGGGLGSLMRYAINIFSAKYISNGFPFSTLISNFLACSLLGIVTVMIIPKHTDSSWIHPLFVVGVCGGFSTFSTFSSETLDLFQSGHTFLGMLNIIISIGTCLGILYLTQLSAK